MTEDSRYICWKCSTSYRIAEPSATAERHRCAERQCGMRFWAALEAGHVKVGIYPDELATNGSAVSAVAAA